MAPEVTPIKEAFVRELEGFVERGYRFDSGLELRKGKNGAHGTQREAFDGYLAGVKAGHWGGRLELPTGVGKTALFISLIECYLKVTENIPKAPRVIIHVPTTKLVVQTAKSFAKFMPQIAPLLETEDDEGKGIDWANSDVGIHYSKLKHAGRKPRVLVTSYQSQIRDTDNLIYPPQEFGFDIEDEGHVTTAEKFGTVTDKFQGSIQLATTATPDYTETKTVKAKFPHCYYQLPLYEAINRQDLCNVRPALLFTNYKVDEKKFQAYIENNATKVLTPAQLEKLLNQEARNRTVLETYFLGADPDSGQRYLGQNGAVYCGGIVHVDDFVRLAYKMLGEKR